MRIQLIAIGQKMPGWVEQGFEEYAHRMPPEVRLELKEIAAAKRGKNADIPRILEDECQRIQASLAKNSRVVVLDVKGSGWSTEQLAQRMGDWMQSGQDVSLLVGGPEGLSEQCRSLADERWSLSALTFPHPLVRIIVAEQLYRAWSVLRNHPYHRA